MEEKVHSNLEKKVMKENPIAQNKWEAKGNEKVKFCFIISELISLNRVRKKEEINFHGQWVLPWDLGLWGAQWNLQEEIPNSSCIYMEDVRPLKSSDLRVKALEVLTKLNLWEWMNMPKRVIQRAAFWGCSVVADRRKQTNKTRSGGCMQDGAEEFKGVCMKKGRKSTKECRDWGRKRWKTVRQLDGPCNGDEQF